MDGLNPGETGAGNGDLSRTDVIDYAQVKVKNGTVVDPATVSSKSRKKRRVTFDGADHARGVDEEGGGGGGGEEEEEEEEEEEGEGEEGRGGGSNDDEYKHKIAYAMKENKKKLDLDEVNTRLEGNTRMDETSSEELEAEGNNLFPHGAAVPSGAVIGAVVGAVTGAAHRAPRSSGQEEKMPCLSERRRKVHWKLSPTLVNDKSVFNWGRNFRDPRLENDADDQVEGNANSGSDATEDANYTTTREDAEMKVPAENAPSSVLEKGIIYFFSRPAVGVADHAQGVEHAARSFFILRRLHLGAESGNAPLPENDEARLLSLPTETWAESMREKFSCVVDKAGLGIEELKAQLSGPSHLPPVTPMAEGIYAIASTDRASHLAYHIAYPRLSAVQTELGVTQKGSFVCLVRNPTAPGQTVGNPAKYPQELQEKFRNARWASMVPEHLNHEGTQLLLVGVAKSVDDDDDDEKNEKIGLGDRLEREDDERVEGLKEDDPIFAELGLNAEEYSQMHTTW